MSLSGASQATPHGWREPVLLRLSTWERGHIRRSGTPQPFRYSYVHQACHRDHRRKSELRSRVRHLSAEAWRGRLEL